MAGQEGFAAASERATLRAAALAELDRHGWRTGFDEPLRSLYTARQDERRPAELMRLYRISCISYMVLFTAFNNQFFSKDITQPMASLPAVIFNFAMSAYDDEHAMAWAGALLITATVLALSIIARLLEQKRT